MKRLLRFVIYTSTCVLIGYLGGLALGVDFDRNKAPERKKNWIHINPESETNIKNDCYEDRN